MSRFLLLALSILTFTSCTETAVPNTYKVVCTTGMLADIVRELAVGIDSIEVLALMGPGTDPHLYKATQGDVQALTGASLIVYNGLHLEGKMQGLFAKLGKERVYAAAEVIPAIELLNASDYANAYDPHVWFDLILWGKVAKGLQNRLIIALPEQAEKIRMNGSRYLKSLDEQHKWALTTIEEVPENQRVLITAHDAFKYFGRAYGMKVRGLQGISTTAEYGLRDISDLADFIVRSQIKAVFIENSVSPRAIEAVQENVKRRGHALKLGGELYSDALGANQSKAGTFHGMFEENVLTIVNALK
jgi:manganese/zinc/iron transport system substrate-binding protein